MENKRKLVVGLASIWAGGGHNALRDFLFMELEHESELELHQFTHSDASYNMMNDAFFGRFPNLYDAIYRNFPNEYPALSALKLVKECEEFVKKVNPDLIISTNFGVLSAFGLIKKTLKLNFINIFAIPDYGRTASAAFPSNHYFKPDFVIVFDEDTKTGLIADQNYPEEKVILSGYTTNRNFRELVADFRKKGRPELFAGIKEESGLELAPEKTTILIAGGAGGIIDKSYSLLKKVVAYQKKDPVFMNSHQFLVITGQNKEFFKKLTKKRQNTSWANIIPVPWISREAYLKLQLVSDFPILITIAPATINELLESHCGPFLIQHCRKGQEQANVDFAVRNKFAYYVPNSKNMLQWIISGFSTQEKEEFITRADNYRDTRLEKLRLLPQEITKIYTDTVDPKRSTDRKRLDFEINWDQISPKILLSIFLMLIPSSMIYAYAQYYKSKHMIMDNKYLAALFNYIPKLWPSWSNES